MKELCFWGIFHQGSIQLKFPKDHTILSSSVLTLSPTLNPSAFLLVFTAAVGVEVVTPDEGALKPGLGIFDPAGSVPIPELELVEAEEVGCGK